MKVLKFGGTSVGSVKSILSLKRIVENEAKKQSVVVVVSALGGITDKLLQTSQLALKGDEQWKVEFEAKKRSSGVACAISYAVGYASNNGGVTWFIRLSVHWADNITATNNSKGSL